MTTNNRPPEDFLNRKKRDEDRAYDARRRKASEKAAENKRREAEEAEAKKGIAAPTGDRTTIAERKGFWATQGFECAEHEGCVRVQDGDCILYDHGDRIHVHGSPSDATMAAMAARAAEHWGGRAKVFGGWHEPQPSNDVDRYWLACKRAGVVVTNYSPSDEFRQRWEREKAATKVVAERAEEVATLQKLAAGGDAPKASESMRQYVASMDSKDAKKLADGHPAEVVAGLDSHRAQYHPDEGGNKGRVYDMASQIAKPAEDGHPIPPPRG